MPFLRENLEFGSASFVGDALNDPSFYDLPLRQQAKVVGWAVGCPVVDELTDPDNQKPGRDPEAMLLRYGEVAFWAGYINRTAEELNPALHNQLTQSVKRLDTEPVGKYETQSVPASYVDEIPPTETLVGYALPRLLIEQIGGKDVPLNEKQSRLTRGLGILESSIIAAHSPEELLALSAEGIAQADVDPLTTLRTALSVGWHREHNADRMLSAFKQALQTDAPKLWQLRTSMISQVR